MSDTRQHVHELIERLPPTKLAAVEGLLEAMLDPTTASDEESVTDEDRRRLREGRTWLAEHGSRGIPMEDVLADFGVTPTDFPSRR